jgi:hypothetical protein
MARSTKAKASKPKQAKRKSGLLAAANLAGIGDFETFTLIREMHDRLAERRADSRASKGARFRMAATSARAEVAADAPWVAIAHGELGQKGLSRSALQSSCGGISQSQYDRPSGQQGRDELVLGLRQLVHGASAPARNE